MQGLAGFDGAVQQRSGGAWLVASDGPGGAAL